MKEFTSCPFCFKRLPLSKTGGKFPEHKGRKVYKRQTYVKQRCVGSGTTPSQIGE